jgi:RTX calcium-binding nonapeptide repeat (4 copies)
LVAIALAMAGASAAQASEVTLRETQGEDAHLVTLEFTAAPGEQNNLTLSGVEVDPNRIAYRLVDSGAAIVAGSGCSGGGAPGEAVDCVAHVAKFEDSESCGRDCLRSVPGTEWRHLLVFHLGDGNNKFNGAGVPGPALAPVEMHVTSGAGNDEISTGSGEDTIDPGAGSDVVRTGSGYDRIATTAQPDGPDVYESGESLDQLSYVSRSAAVHLHDSTAGAAGEGDTLVGLFEVLGGSGDDVLEGGQSEPIIQGGPGADTISGTAGANYLYGGTGDDRLSTVDAPADSSNRLIGEEGNDTYYGGEGTDVIRDGEIHLFGGGAKPEYGPNPPASGGEDTAYGGGGNDVLDLLGGDDVAYGGAGADALNGGSGKDRLRGGDGRDLLIGGSGFDRLFGGKARDYLFSGRWMPNLVSAKTANLFPFPAVKDDGRDRVDCGPGRDAVFANPWDRLLRCEGKHLRPRPHGGKKMIS